MTFINRKAYNTKDSMVAKIKRQFYIRMGAQWKMPVQGSEAA